MVAVLQPTEAERLEQLTAQRAALLKRINFAVAQSRYLALRNPDEARAWLTNARSLRIDLEMIDGDLMHYRTPKDERYAEVRAQMRHEDETRTVVSDGSTEWEAM